MAVSCFISYATVAVRVIYLIVIFTVSHISVCERESDASVWLIIKSRQLKLCVWVTGVQMRRRKKTTLSKEEKKKKREIRWAGEKELAGKDEVKKNLTKTMVKELESKCQRRQTGHTSSSRVWHCNKTHSVLFTIWLMFCWSWEKHACLIITRVAKVWDFHCLRMQYPGYLICI